MSRAVDRGMLGAVVTALRERLTGLGLGLEASFIDSDDPGELRSHLEQVKVRVEAELQRVEELDELVMFRLTVEFPTGVGDSQTGMELKSRREALTRRRQGLRQLSEAIPAVLGYLDGERDSIENVVLELMVDPTAEG